MAAAKAPWPRQWGMRESCRWCLGFDARSPPTRRGRALQNPEDAKLTGKDDVHVLYEDELECEELFEKSQYFTGDWRRPCPHLRKAVRGTGELDERKDCGTFVLHGNGNNNSNTNDPPLVFTRV